MLDDGSSVIVTSVVANTDAQPPDAPIVYVTVYVPAELLDGIIEPVLASIDKPEADEYVPPEEPDC
jgi:hypothetical protein